MQVISRKEAIEKGLNFYFTGKPCKRGHISHRYVTSKCCISCKKEYDKVYHKNWYRDNKEHRKEYDREYGKEYYLKNREQRKEYNNQYYQNNTEYMKKRSKKYREENIEKTREQDRSYKKKRYSTDPLYKSSCIMRNMIRRYIGVSKKQKTESTSKMLGYSCEEFEFHISTRMLYGMSWDNQNEWHIDHIHPVSRFIKEGVSDPSIINGLDNLAPMWAVHNHEKGNKTLEEWLSEKGEDSEEYRLYGHYLNKE